MTNTNLNPSKIAVVIFAQNESPVIKNTVDNIRHSLRTSDSLYVIADNCSDDTADIARSAGAQVLVRDSVNQPGKGAAITWFLKTYRAQILCCDYMLILDADTLIPDDFFEKLDSQLTPGVSVAQCSILPTGFEESPIMAIIALSEMVEQIVFNSIRSFLGFSVRLRGTGMIFDPALLIRIGPHIGTEVEDVALSLLVAEQKVPVRWFKSVGVFDPKPGECTDATRQRARWFRGQWRAFWDYRWIVLKLFARGPHGWSVLSSLFLKPRWLKLTLMMLLGFALWKLPVAAAVVFSVIGLEIVLILLGTILLPKRRLFMRSLMYIPGFIVMWLKGIVLSLKRHQWLRVHKSLKLQEDYDPETVIFK